MGGSPKLAFDHRLAQACHGLRSGEQLDQSGAKAQLWLAPGNHDVSNAIGYYKTMSPLKDSSSMAGIYNFMFTPAVPLTKDTYSYAANKIHYTKDVGGVHIAVLNMWPDSGERAWLESDLSTVGARTPVLSKNASPRFCHKIAEIRILNPRA